MTANPEQAKYWAERAPSWLAAEAQSELVINGPGTAAMDRLPLAPGQRVVDLGCGSGRTTVELARRVSPGGKAVGVDIAAQMVEFARSQAGDAAVEFVAADVQDHDLGAATFDRAYSRFGVMFFSDPVAAFANVRRSLRPGGVLAFACWRPVLENDWMLVPGAAAMSVTGASPQLPEPGAPGPFSLGDADHIRTVLGAAGFAEIEVDVFDDPFVFPQADVASFAAHATTVGPVREAMASADDDTRRRILSSIEDALTAKVTGGDVRLSRAANIVAAR